MVAKLLTNISGDEGILIDQLKELSIAGKLIVLCTFNLLRLRRTTVTNLNHLKHLVSKPGVAN